MKLVRYLARMRSLLANNNPKIVSPSIRGLKTNSTLAPPVIKLWPVGGGCVVVGVVTGYWQFGKFVSLKYGGVEFMSPQDFIESVIADYPRPR